jgi:hypothetical protein
MLNDVKRSLENPSATKPLRAVSVSYYECTQAAYRSCSAGLSITPWSKAMQTSNHEQIGVSGGTLPESYTM